eukprot:TRINITY_DN8864_c0_g1_i1.p1 TRINITY_DN8864_c0_g1~~TRINITY_DN8864_c0_g1_i1.p1  ORF type:complete len:533 (+),score=82.42 TRINITY_DN8864_c0_g1_i1:129-1727(+)
MAKVFRLMMAAVVLWFVAMLITFIIYPYVSPSPPPQPPLPHHGAEGKENPYQLYYTKPQPPYNLQSPTTTPRITTTTEPPKLPPPHIPHIPTTASIVDEPSPPSPPSKSVSGDVKWIERGDDERVAEPLLIVPEEEGDNKEEEPVRKSYDIRDCKDFPGVCHTNFDRCTIDRRRNLSWREFEEQYRKPGVPVILEGIIPHLNWTASRWGDDVTMFTDLQDLWFPYGPNGEEDYLPLDHIWHDYDERQRWPFPASNLANLGVIYGITEVDPTRWWQHPPSLSANDVFQYLVSLQRVLQFDFGYGSHWIVFGPTGAGTTFHKDYYDTSFYNACIRGSKHWVVLPPVDSEAFTNTVTAWAEQSNQEWFRDVYPKLSETVKFQECTQRAGDIVWSPNGWYHQTINFEKSVSVSSNFILHSHLDASFDTLLHPDFETRFETGDPSDSITRGMYLCLALHLLDPERYAASFCASSEYLTELDQEQPILSLSVVDFVLNSEYYLSLEPKFQDWIRSASADTQQSVERIRESYRNNLMTL